MKDFQKLSKSSKKIPTKTGMVIEKLTTEIKNDKNYLVNLSENDLKEVCLTTQNRIFKNNKIANEFLEKVPLITKEKLFTQERVLLKSANHLKESEHLMRALSSYSKKKPTELLLTKSDFYRQQKEKRELHETSRPLDEKYGCNTWLMSLRRPKEFKGLRFVDINIGTHQRPIWSRVSRIRAIR